MAKHTYGSLPSKMPEGFAKAVHFPVLMVMDKTTGDGRHFASKGGSVREGLPHTISTMLSEQRGHDGSVPSGALFQVELDDETGIVSGDGFLLDDEVGLLTARWVMTGAQNKNSVHVADVKAQFVEDFDTGEYWINFSKWAIASTTFVSVPAFGESYGEITAAFDSMLADPAPLVCQFSGFETHFAGEEVEVEVVADGIPRVPYDSFLIPESAAPHKVKTDGAKIWGHLGVWNTCHDGLPGCVMIPRPRDGYASFNQAGALTERGQVQSGPIFALGGHRSLIGLTAAEEAAAYGGIENSWCDVRVTEGVFGPWVSGHIRPGVDPNLAYAAVASRISGHWKGDKLKAIVSVNSEGFRVDGNPDEVLASFEFAVDENGESELFASFPACMETPETPVAPMVSGLTLDEIVAAVTARMSASDTPVEPTPADPLEVRRLALMLLLDDDDGDDE